MRIVFALILIGTMLAFTPLAKAAPIVGIGFGELSSGQDVLDFYSGLGVFF